MLVALVGCGRGEEPPAPAAANQLVPPLAATSPPVPGGGPGPTGTPFVERPPSLTILRQVRPPDTEALAAGSASCGNVRALPASENLGQQAQVILCLLNAERRSRGLGTLRLNSLLSRASLGHSTDMVTNQYFAHDARNGRTMTDRLRGVRYVSLKQRFSIGENIAWGSGSLASPEALVDAWMASPGHRANILQPKYREVGIGMKLGAPKGGVGNPAVTVTTDFGRVG